MENHRFDFEDRTHVKRQKTGKMGSSYSDGVSDDEAGGVSLAGHNGLFYVRFSRD